MIFYKKQKSLGKVKNRSVYGRGRKVYTGCPKEGSDENAPMSGNKEMRQSDWLRGFLSFTL